MKPLLETESMKLPFSLKSCQKLTAVLSFLTVGASWSHAAPPTPAASPTPMSSSSAFRTAVTVDSLLIVNLQRFAGKNLHVFYVSGREAALGFSGQTLKIRAVKQAPTRYEIPASGDITIPTTQVANSGYQTFNYIVFAITPKETQNLYLRNSDGTYPEDPRKPNYLSLRDIDFKTEKLGFMSMIQVNDIRNSRLESNSRTNGALAAENTPIVLDGLKDF